MSSRRKSAKPIKYVPADHKHPSAGRRPNDAPVAELPTFKMSARIKNEKEEKVITAVEKVGVSKSGTASARKRAADENQDSSKADQFPPSNGSSEVASPPQSKSYQDAKLETAKAPRRRKSAKPLKFVPEPAEEIKVRTFCIIFFLKTFKCLKIICILCT